MSLGPGLILVLQKRNASGFARKTVREAEAEFENAPSILQKPSGRSAAVVIRQLMATVVEEKPTNCMLVVG